MILVYNIINVIEFIKKTHDSELITLLSFIPPKMLYENIVHHIQYYLPNFKKL